MPNLKDAPVLVVGIVVTTDPIYKRDSEPKQLEGHKVTLMSGDGFAVVKVTNEDIARAGILIPEPQQQVAWFIRNTPYSVDNNSGMSTRFVRVVNPQDAEIVAHVVGIAPVPAGK